RGRGGGRGGSGRAGRVVFRAPGGRGPAGDQSPPPPLARSQKLVRHIPPLRSHSCCADMTGEVVAMSAQPDTTAAKTKRTKPVDTVLAIGASPEETRGPPRRVPGPDQRLSRRAP